MVVTAGRRPADAVLRFVRLRRGGGGRSACCRLADRSCACRRGSRCRCARCSGCRGCSRGRRARLLAELLRAALADCLGRRAARFVFLLLEDSPIGIACPSVLTVTCITRPFCWSDRAMLPLSSRMSCRSSFHASGCADDLNLKVQLFRPSASRSRSTEGLTRLMVGITMSCVSSGSIFTWKSICSSVAKYRCFAQSGFAIVMLRAAKVGHSTHARQPVSPAARCQRTVRSPLIVNGRPIAALTLSSISGRARFQSNVKMNSAIAASRMISTATSHATTLPITLAIVLPDAFDRAMAEVFEVHGPAPRGPGRQQDSNRRTANRPGCLGGQARNLLARRVLYRRRRAEWRAAWRQGPHSGRDIAWTLVSAAPSSSVARRSE